MRRRFSYTLQIRTWALGRDGRHTRTLRKCNLSLHETRERLEWFKKFTIFIDDCYCYQFATVFCAKTIFIRKISTIWHHCPFYFSLTILEIIDKEAIMCF